MKTLRRAGVWLGLGLASTSLGGCRIVLDVDDVKFVEATGGGSGGGGSSAAGAAAGVAGAPSTAGTAGAAGADGTAGTAGQAGAAGEGGTDAGAGGVAGNGGTGDAAGSGGTSGAAGNGGTSGAAGSGGAAGAAGSSAFPLTGTVIRLEADQKFLTDGVDRVHDWLDLGDYAPTANIGLHAPENGAPRFLVGKLGDRSVRFAFEEKDDYLRFSYGNQLDDWSKGLTLSFLVRFGALLPYQALFDCGANEDTDDLRSLEGRIFVGSDGLSDNLGYFVFGVEGQGLTHVTAQALVNDPDIFKLVTIRHSSMGLVTISVGSEVKASGLGPPPVALARTRCNLGKSLLSNKPDNAHFDGAVRAIYAFKRPIDEEELKQLDAYVFTRFSRK